MKKVAILGFGSMGRLHYDVWKVLKGVRVVAVCDKNPAGFKQPARAYIRAAVVLNQNARACRLYRLRRLIEAARAFPFP